MDVVCEQGKRFGQGISLQLSDCHSYCSFLDDCFVMATEPSWSLLLFHADHSQSADPLWTAFIREKGIQCILSVRSLPIENTLVQTFPDSLGSYSPALQTCLESYLYDTAGSTVSQPQRKGSLIGPVPPKQSVNWT